jgi:hypothetical protein
VARTLSEHDSPAVAQAWLTGVNPELGDRVPLRLMRENEIDAGGASHPERRQSIPRRQVDGQFTLKLHG